jgi:hypothetical protein
MPKMVKAGIQTRTPPEGQVPLGNSGIYVSPNVLQPKITDPRNLVRPTSFGGSGGNVLDPAPLGGEIDIGITSCGLWMEVTSEVGPTRFPPVSIGYRLPGKCREGEPPPPPPPPDIEDHQEKPVSPVDLPKTIAPNATVFIALLLVYKYERVFDDEMISTNPGSETLVFTESLVDGKYPIVDTYVPSYLPYGGNVLAIGGVTTRNTISQQVNRKKLKSNKQVTQTGTAWITSDQRPPSIPNYKRYTARKLKGDYLISAIRVPGNLDFNQSTGVIMYGKFGEISADWDGFAVDVTGYLNDGHTSYILKEEYKIAYISVPIQNKFPPPPDQKRKKECCMQCCRSGNENQNDALLRQILRNQQKIMKILDVDGFPHPLPERLTSNEVKLIPHENIPDILNRQIYLLDELIGQFPLEFEVERPKEGGKDGETEKHKVSIPNISEALTELSAHQISASIDSQLIVQMAVKSLIEHGMHRKMSYLMHTKIQAIEDFLGFKVKTSTEDMELTFTVPGN